MKPVRFATLSRVALAALLPFLAGCSGPPNEEETISLPSQEQFAPVGYVFGAHCGTLDCHGAPARNLRIYGINGHRLGASDVTGFGGTTEEELRATYESIVALQPERLAAIVQAGGEPAGDWLVLGKARGRIAHTGGQQFVPGQAPDTCVTSWLAGRFDDAFRNACEQGAIVAAPTEDF
jgi:hypothetical protein